MKIEQESPGHYRSGWDLHFTGHVTAIHQQLSSLHRTRAPQTEVNQSSQSINCFSSCYRIMDETFSLIWFVLKTPDHAFYTILITKGVPFITIFLFPKANICLFWYIFTVEMAFLIFFDFKSTFPLHFVIL